MRLIARRVCPPRRHLKKLAKFLEALHHPHAGVKDRVRTNKAMRLDNLPSASCEVNRSSMVAANLTADLDA